METLNPFEPPLTPAGTVVSPWPEGGAYRDRSYVVLHHTSVLPPICVRTACPAETSVLYVLTGGVPNDRSIPPARRRLFWPRIYEVRLPLARRAETWMNRGSRLSALLGGTLFVALVVTLWRYGGDPIWTWQSWALMAIVLGLVFSAGLNVYSSINLQLVSVAHGYYWIKGLPRVYLAALPPWPVPRPNPIAELFLGPAGPWSPPGNADDA